MELTSDTNSNANTNLASKPSIEDEGTNFYAIEKIVAHENRLTGTHYNVRWYGNEPQEDTVEPATHIADHVGLQAGKDKNQLLMTKATKNTGGPIMRRHAIGRNPTRMNSLRTPAPTFLDFSPRLLLQSHPYTNKICTPPTW